MRVLHVIPSLSGSYGGPVQAVIQLCQELKNQGIEVAIATTAIDEDKIHVIHNSIPTYSFSRQFSSFLPSEFAFSYGIKRWLRQHTRKFDLLHVHYIFTYPSTFACYYANKYGIPYIVRPAGMLSGLCLKQSVFKKKLYTLIREKRNLKNAAAIHFTSEAEMDAATGIKLDRQPILAPHGLDLEKFSNLESLKGLFRKHYPEINGRKIILFLSRIDPIKGFDLLAPALKILSGKRSDFVFVLAGSGYKNDEKRVRHIFANAGLTGLTILTGFLEGEMKFALLADANVFILPSYHENFGMAVVEAMAAGLPVIISKRVNIYKLIEDYQAGIVTGLDSGDMALALDRLLGDGQLCLEMGAHGKRLVQENFDVKKTAKQMLEIYSHLTLNADAKKKVKRYWEDEVCGSRYGVSRNRIEWFREIEQARYKLEPHITDFAEFDKYSGKRVLEIGVGSGTDFINWIRNRAIGVGIDFSQHSVQLTKQHIELEGINSECFSLCAADAEKLPFKDNTFELVYAWGVLHHTPDTAMAIKEIYRVLKPFGIIKAMLYHIPSWTGWMLWFRFCLLRFKPWVAPKEAIFKYLESPGTEAYTLQEARRLFESAQFQEIEAGSVLGPGDLLCIYPSKKYSSFIYRILWLIYPRWLVRLLGNSFGLELLLQAKKY